MMARGGANFNEGVDCQLIERLAYLAGLAPSADNNQPWEFKLNRDKLEVFLCPARRIRSDRQGMFDYLSIGAALENLKVAAAEHGLGVELKYLPDAARPELAAEVCFRGGASSSELYPYIFTRHTNRRWYRRRALDAACVAEVEAAFRGDGTRVFWAMDRAAIRELAGMVGKVDALRMGSMDFRAEIKGALCFKRDQAWKRGDGILFESLEMPAPAKMLLRCFDRPLFMRLMKCLGFGASVSVISRLQAAASGGLGLVCVPRLAPPEYLKGGEAFERLWLILAKHGAWLQPLGAYSLFSALAGEADSHFDDSARKLLGEARELVGRIFPEAAGFFPLLLFRAGYAAAPSAVTAHRMPTGGFLDLGAGAQPKSGFDYSVAFSRNLGLIGHNEQQRLRHCTVAIPGLGGVGGGHLMTLARVGIGGFHIADFDEFALANMNRQYGALASSLGKEKLEVMSAMVRDVNPEIRLKTWREAIGPENVRGFLRGADLVIDSVDAFSVAARRVIFNTAREMGIPVITAGPIGFGCALITFLPHSMPFDRYFDYREDQDPNDQFAAFIAGLVPGLKPLRYLDTGEVDPGKRRGPSSGAAVALCAGFAAVEALKIILQRKRVYASPYYYSFDPYLMRFKRGRLLWGNRGPLQRVYRRILQRAMQRR